MRPLRLLILILVALLAVTGGYLWQRRADRDSRLAVLESQRDSLRLRLAALRAGGDLLAEAPRSRIALGIPSGYAGAPAPMQPAAPKRAMDRRRPAPPASYTPEVSRPTKQRSPFVWFVWLALLFGLAVAIYLAWSWLF